MPDERAQDQGICAVYMLHCVREPANRTRIEAMGQTDNKHVCPGNRGAVEHVGETP